jgi:hypothetical protein
MIATDLIDRLVNDRSWGPEALTQHLSTVFRRALVADG